MYRLKKIGALRPTPAAEIPESRLGIGFEKLDRAVFEPERAYDKLAAIGVKWVRIQSGWNRTEREKGVYNFDWIDSIVDNLIARGMIPWVCLCYGNDLYFEDAVGTLGAVGFVPIHNEEQKRGWHDYCVAFARHFAGRVKYYEIWNEPDCSYAWRPEPNPEELGVFNIDTARAIREGCADTYLIGGAFATGSLPFAAKTFASGMLNDVDAISYHEYVYDEMNVTQKVRAFRGLLNMEGKPEIEIVQGESGSPSKVNGHGALAKGGWTEEKQAKLLLRHMMTDLLAGVMFTSFFTCVDMIEAHHGIIGDKSSYLDYGYFGVLSADFDDDGLATGNYTPKVSYRALQALSALLGGKVTNIDLPVRMIPDSAPHTGGAPSLNYNTAISGGFKLGNGSYAFVYWKPAELMTTNWLGAVTIESTVPGTPHLVDPMDGAVYEIPDTILQNPGAVRPANTYTDFGENARLFKHLPAKDYPMFLVFGDVPRFEAE